MDIHDFMQRAAKPMYVFRMARSRHEVLSRHEEVVPTSERKSASTRMQNATAEIEELVLAFADDIRKQRESS